MSAKQKIEESRKTLKPTTVELHKYPMWLKKRCRAYLKAKDKSDFKQDAVADFCKYLLEFGSVAPWMDHMGSSAIQGEECFVSEPYHFTTDDALHLDLITNALDIEWYVSSNSYWYPGYTLRIVIRERKDARP